MIHQCLEMCIFFCNNLIQFIDLCRMLEFPCFVHAHKGLWVLCYSINNKTEAETQYNSKTKRNEGEGGSEDFVKGKRKWDTDGGRQEGELFPDAEARCQYDAFIFLSASCQAYVSKWPAQAGGRWETSHWDYQSPSMSLTAPTSICVLLTFLFLSFSSTLLPHYSFQWSFTSDFIDWFLCLSLP